MISITGRFICRERGFTLIEILVVLAIIAIISGFSLAFLVHSDKQYAFMSTRGAVVSLLRLARTTAQTERIPTTAVIDPSTRQIYYLEPRAIAYWHFEDLNNGITTGSLGYDAQASGVSLTPEGKYGNALYFPSSGGMVSCQNFSFVVSEAYGFIIETWIYPSRLEIPPEKPQVIIEKPNEFSLSLDPSGGLLLNGFSTTPITTTPETISFDRWNQIRLIYEKDNSTLSLLVNDTTIATVTADYNLNSSQRGFQISSHVFPFCGRIDEVSIKQPIRTENILLKPEDITITADKTIPRTKTGAYQIIFDRLGNTSPGKLIFSSAIAGISFQVEFTSGGFIYIK